MFRWIAKAEHFLALLVLCLTLKHTRGQSGMDPVGGPWTISHEPGMCSGFGSCGYNNGVDNPKIRGEMSCANNVPASTISKITEPTWFDSLESVCPMLVSPEGPTKVCCDRSQLRTLETQLTASELIFQRCPSCLENFVTLYCQITCSPNQATFVNVTNLYQNVDETMPGVSGQSVYISKKMADGLHASCKDVTFPQTNGKAIALVCNGFSGDACTSQQFLNYLGSTNNGVAPVDMDFQQIGNNTGINSVTTPEPPEGMDVLDANTYSCNESPKIGSSACSCTDCLASCPALPPLPEAPEKFMIGTADGVGVISLIVFLSLTLLFLTYIMITCACKAKKKKVMDYSAAAAEEKLGRLSSTSSKAQLTEAAISDNAGRPLVQKHQISKFQKLGKAFQDKLSSGFRWWGTFVAKHPLLVLIPTIAIVVGLSVGMKFVILTTDPIALWSSPQSRVRLEKDYYDSHFGPFYRTEMVIMKLKPEYQGNGTLYSSFTGINYNFSEILKKEYLLASLDLQNHLRYMEVSYEENGKTVNGSLNDICFKPLEPTNNNCTITSVINYWQGDPALLNETVVHQDKITQKNYTVDYRDHFLYCVQAPATLQDTTPLKQNCMGDYGGPVFPYLVVGGLGEDELYNEATAMILTFVVNNVDKGDNRTKLIKAWEQAFIEYMAAWESEYFDFTYFSERSPEDELIRSSEADLTIFLISYIVIFVYITVALGSYSSFKRIPVDFKATLGIGGILVILSSVLTSIGFFGYIGYETSLIVIEVVPFLVLAIGADNVFILSLEFDRSERKEGETLAEQIGRVFGDVAPSMTLCSITECAAFFLGALTNMPAVEQFALAAAVAIVFDFLLQITAFLAILSLDARRHEDDRVDCLCCVKGKKATEPYKSYLQIFFEKYYAPFLMNDLVRITVMIVFTGLSCWCVVLSGNMTVGLDQDLSVPSDSYVLDYFDYMEKYLDVGVPVYFVTKGPYNFSYPNASSMICGSAGCDTYSLTQQIFFASQRPDYWKIETSAASWYDDYVDWLTPTGLGGSSSCCRYYHKDADEFCPATVEDTVFDRCDPCLDDESYDSQEFMKYLPWFLIDNPGLECNKGGHSAYGNAVNITSNYTGSGYDVVQSSYFMSYHSVCIKSVDCTENLIKARELADNITKTLRAANPANNTYILENEDDFSVFPYCLYYVYYEQYLTMVDDTLFQVGICLIPTFLFCFILLGFDWYSGIVTVVTILMIVVDTAGLSSLWGVDLNAVSLINLVAAIGLSVEFTIHVVRTFSLKTNPSKKERIIESMGTMGPAVFAGVALTNLPGIIVLNWATAQLIQIFFFRMCLIITLLGMAHGLIFLPVFLSYFGPPVNKAILYEKQTVLREEAEKEGIANLSFIDEKKTSTIL
ncbi:NPC1-like intracellular cholesterol transporter 1 [Clavelina lepadiformis]|uniref:NPC1-like intracellular cholesterol transporter 1 n=1 Tax=Clavelina lepadiformis TaxID=159417 RepID=UPI004040EBD6